MPLAVNDAVVEPVCQVACETFHLRAQPLPASSIGCRLVREKALEYLIGEQAATRREADAMAVSPQKSVADQFCNRGRQVVDSLPIEARGRLSQIDSAVQAQSEKEELFQSVRRRDTGLLQRRSSKVVFEDVRGGKTHRFVLRRR